MLNRIVDWAVTNRLLVLLLLLASIAAAALMIPRLNLDAFPDVTNVQVTVNAEAPGLAAEEVEQLITFPIESVMYALPDVAQVRSISKTGLSGVTVVFKEGTDIYFARQLVFERLQAAREMIPEGVGIPEIGPNTSGLGQVFQYLLKVDPGSNYDVMQLRSLNDWVVKLLLMPVDGVTEVLSFGGDVKQYQVEIDSNKLLSYGLQTADIVDAIEANNRNAGGWYMDRGNEQLVVRGVGWLRNGTDGLADIAAIPLKEQDGTLVRVSDIARVGFGSEIRQGAVSLSMRNGSGAAESLGEVVTGIVLKRMGSNTNATIEGIKARIPLINRALPDGVTFEPFYDQADLVSKAINTVVTALLQAFAFIVIVLSLFLLNLRATALVLISIPLSVGLALALMAYYGLSANLMSLGGLAIAIGMMVDGAVVMMENIFKHLSHPDQMHEGHTAPDSDDPYAASTDNSGIPLRIKMAAREVARPVFFAVMIIVVVFAPLFSLDGVEGKLFQPMAITIIIAMLAALLVALIIVPAMASYLFRSGIREKESPILKPLDAAYRFLLQRALRFRQAVVALAIASVLGTMALVPQLGTEFVPELEEGTINIRVTLAPSANLDTALEIAPKLEQTLLQFPEVTYALSRIGRPELGGDPEPVSNVEIYVGLKPQSEWTTAPTRQELQQQFKEKLEIFPGLLLNFSQPIATRVDELLSGVKAQLAIKLFGPDLATLAEKGREIEQQVRQIDGTRDVAMEQVEGEAQLVIRPDREQLFRYGLAIGDIIDLVETGIGGMAAGQVVNGNERYDIYVRLAQNQRNNIARLRDLRLQSANGAWVKLGDVAQVAIESGPPQIRRDDVQRRVVVQANVEGRDMGSIVRDINAAIDTRVELPAGYTVSIGGQFENQQRAQAKLMVVVPLSIALIGLLLYFSFGSTMQATLVLLNLPLALIGGVLALYLSGQYLSVPSSIGFITLFGVAVLNGVVMVESINLRLEAGQELQTAIFEGACSRLRPVMMTALTSAFGLIPILMSTEIGSEIQKPLATVVVGGLISATLLTLFIIPVLYAPFSRSKYRHEQ
ncbi:efflux RND transporter permease subunit [Marinobacterium jannaschii]|uniref:efflux RND transporter permease subunit n=1 Tax=Marinobacterium jannaschii TaxID=64970 RepID=UPI0004818A09|nr:CusA/CzcA family heavy metal efflux RND transporter [Marinobacterium jannaschii]